MMFITTEFNGHTTAAREQHLWCSAEAPLRWSLISPHLEENPLSHNCRNPQPNLQNPAYASMKSNNSVIQPFTFSNKGEPPEPSYVSMKSNNSIIQPLTFSNKGEPPASSGRSGLVQDQSRCGVWEQNCSVRRLYLSLLQKEIYNTSCFTSRHRGVYKSGFLSTSG
ncbi:uncharacterized protein LOC125797546 isoform X3 [Astyanax mexicanus]|uniref:uncharacterized protein LOC125797546 isoform X3 n=1 Tax=Astyanax mexicanus TaxID=7994 RepID=UPI0020CB0AF5|nr:uncharacterized protein LOC125797546 isoform X3 [Astyanax mexicanus]